MDTQFNMEIWAAFGKGANKGPANGPWPSCHKLATAPQRAKQRMAEFCGLHAGGGLWRKPLILLCYGKRIPAKSLKEKWRERPDLNRRPLP